MHKRRHFISIWSKDEGLLCGRPRTAGGVEVGEENMALRDGAGGMDKWMDPTSPHNDEEVSARTG